LRRAITKLNWIENSRKNEMCHVKFDIADTNIKVKSNYFYNHFPDNRQLTTKAGLCKNLYNLSSNESQ
jgi:hypothetical protein